MKNMRVLVCGGLLAAVGIGLSSELRAGPITGLARLALLSAATYCVYDSLYHEGKGTKNIVGKIKIRIDSSCQDIKKRTLEEIRKELAIDQINETLRACVHDVEALKKQQGKH